MESTQAGPRWHIVHTHKEHPDWSYRQVGRAVGRHHRDVKHWIDEYERTGDVKDKPRTGRKPLLSQADVAKCMEITLRQHTPAKCSASRLSRALQAEGGSIASARTFSRHLRAVKFGFNSARKVLMLSASQKAKRLAWAKEHLRKPFSSWLFTDSKIFMLHRAAGKVGVRVWYPPGCRPTCAVPKHSLGLHGYIGVSKHGVTRIIWVTGGGSQKSRYIDPRTSKPYKGLCAEEYQNDVLPKLIHDGNILFAANSVKGADWIFQQDNAPSHTAIGTKELLQELKPNCVEFAWPANSPDLSWVENLWAWAARRVEVDYAHVETIPQLKAALVDIFRNVPHNMLRNYVTGMRGRMEKVVKAGGDWID